VPDAREITEAETATPAKLNSDEVRAKRLANLKPFKKGECGNPNGRPKLSFAIADVAQRHAEKAIGALVKVIDDKDAPHAAKVTAANSILDRAYGKAPQSIDLNGKIGFSDQFEDFIRNLTAGVSAKVINGSLAE
jgi:hypothetical protein